MIFLIHYDRASGLLIELREYPDDLKKQSAKDRLDLEIELLANGVRREVVLLEANSLDALQRTHNRYFRGVGDIAKSVRKMTKFSDGSEES